MLIVQSDAFNRSAIQTIVVVAISSNVRLASAPGNVLIPRNATTLAKASVANVSQVLTLDKSVIATRIGVLPPELFQRVEAGIRLVLQL